MRLVCVTGWWRGRARGQAGRAGTAVIEAGREEGVRLLLPPPSSLPLAPYAGRPQHLLPQLLLPPPPLQLQLLLGENAQPLALRSVARTTGTRCCRLVPVVQLGGRRCCTEGTRVRRADSEG